MKNNFFDRFQQLGKAFMLPIAVLPAAGLLLGIGGALSNPNTIASYEFLNTPLLQTIFKVMSNAGNAVFSNLPLILCVGLAIGLPKKDKGTAGLAALVSFVVMIATINGLHSMFTPDKASIDTGVIGALAIGITVTTLHEKYRNIELPAFLGFFGGSRFIPIVASFTAIILGAFFFFVWPPFQKVLISLGGSVSKLGYVGTFLYGFILRLTGAVGLHHVFYSLFWYTEIGGNEVVQGVQVAGAQKIFFAQLADPTHQGLYTHGTRFFAGRFATMMFGLPGAALAMYHCAKKENKKVVLGLFLGGALTSFITGITEPLEFMFLFISPFLYVWHAFLDGLSFMFSDILSIRIGNTFSGGAIDYLLFGVLQGEDKTHWLYVLPLGGVWFTLYYLSFKFFITRFNIKTPGREDEVEGEEIKVTTKGNIKEEALLVVEAFGGIENIANLDACITRLRVTLKDNSLLDKVALKKIGAVDVLEVGDNLQAIFGAKAILYKNAIFDTYDLEN